MTKNKKPLPYIQNHINWCWAVSAKIVGFHYAKLKNLELPFDYDIKYPFGIKSNIKNGLAERCMGIDNGLPTIDVWQSMIVQNAKSKTKNIYGDLPEDDSAKVRALKYVVSGDINSKEIEVCEFGYYDDEIPLCEFNNFIEIKNVLEQGYAIIGNCIFFNGLAHSLVIFPHNEKLKIYDPKNGATDICSYDQVFRTGFLTDSGQAVVKWVQYIKP
ncbi:MAG: hypothetical protein R3Y24_02710 [Eubacteriales bacterium]